MANGIPVRLSADLAHRARQAAETADRSVTDQVEHWARLGQAVEDVVLATTVHKLKSRSHDADLQKRLAMVDTADGRAKALALIKSRNPIRYGIDANGELKSVRQRGAAAAAVIPIAAAKTNAKTATRSTTAAMPSEATAAKRAEAAKRTDIPKRATSKRRAR